MSASLATLGAMLAASTTPAAVLPPGFAQQADKIVAQSWPADGPGAAVIVTEGGKPIYERGRGVLSV